MKSPDERAEEVIANWKAKNNWERETCCEKHSHGECYLAHYISKVLTHAEAEGFKRGMDCAAKMVCRGCEQGIEPVKAMDYELWFHVGIDGKYSDMCRAAAIREAGLK